MKIFEKENKKFAPSLNGENFKNFVCKSKVKETKIKIKMGRKKDKAVKILIQLRQNMKHVEQKNKN